MITKRLSSCFICDVEISDTQIVLTDSGRKCFYIDRKTCSKDTIDNFKSWFENCYMKGVAQMITIVDYNIAENNDGEAIMIVNKLIYSTHPKGGV